MTKLQKRIFIGILFSVFILIFFGFKIKIPIEGLKVFFAEHTVLGPVVYILANISTIVIMPLTMMPFIPFGVEIFGWFWAGLLFYTGWTIGSLLAFTISRKFGRPFISRFISLETIDKMEQKIPEGLEIGFLLFLRVVLPADILSYALGLTKLEWRKYVLITLIGLLPFSFFGSFLGKLVGMLIF